MLSFLGNFMINIDLLIMQKLATKTKKGGDCVIRQLPEFWSSGLVSTFNNPPCRGVTPLPILAQSR